MTTETTAAAARTLIDAYETDDSIRVLASRVLDGAATTDQIEAVTDLAEAVRDEVDEAGELRRGQLSSERLSGLERVARSASDFGAGDDDEAL